MAKGLSKTQQELLNKAHRDIDNARNSQDIVEWYRSIKSGNWIKMMTHDELAQKLKEDDEDGWYTQSYNELLSGIVHTQANGRTLYRLQELGLIEIIDDQTHTIMYDTVKILNY